MEENNNVQQLSVALNQLLDAYENLQNENKELTSKFEEIQNKNTELENKLNSLNTETNIQSTEMGDMLTRIETILSDPFETKPVSDEIPEESKLQEEITIEQSNEQNNNETPKQEDSKAVDLGRMQSLLNGFNN